MLVTMKMQPNLVYRHLHLLVSGLAERLSRLAQDDLLNAMDTGHMNIVNTLTDPKMALDSQIMRGINDHFLAMRDNLTDEGGNETYPFFIRSYSFWRSAVRSWASGALPETFSLLRSSLEYAAQGNRLKLGDTSLFEEWCNRHVDPKKHRNKFTFGKALPSIDADYEKAMSWLYDLCIELGAHPNPAGTFTGIRESKEGALQVAYQCGTEREMIEIADYLAIAGVCILQVFRRCYPGCYARIGIEKSLNDLTLDVIEVFDIRENLRKELEEELGEEEELGWISIVREDGIWGTTEVRAQASSEAEQKV